MSFEFSQTSQAVSVSQIESVTKPANGRTIAGRIASSVLSFSMLANPVGATQETQEAPLSPPHFLTTSEPVKGGESMEAAQPQRLTVFQVNVQEAKDFRPITASPQDLKSGVEGGWHMFAKATRGYLSSDAIVDVRPPLDIVLPGVTKAPDLCDEGQRNEFRDKLMNAVLPKDPKEKQALGIPVVITHPKAGCVVADGKPDAGIVSYVGGISASITAHEVGHVKGLDHSNSVNCPLWSPIQDYTVDVRCKSFEDGDPFSGMGKDALAGDYDFLTGVALKHLGVIEPSGIITVPAGKQSLFKLNALNGGHEGPRLARVEFEPTEIYYDDVSGRAYTTINNVYFEISSAVTRSDPNNQSVSLKVYGTDDKSSFPASFLLKVDGQTSFGLDENFGLMHYLRIGGHRIGFALQSLTIAGSGTGGANMLVNVQHLPQPDYISGP